MNKKKNLNLPSKTKLPHELLNYDKMHMCFSFKYLCSKNCLLKDWSSPTHLNDLQNTLKLFSSLTWLEISQNKSLQLDRIDRVSKPLPADIPKDVSHFYEIRVNSRSAKRLFGFRTKNVFNVIWFDLEHSICPDKNRKQYKLS